MKHLVNPTASTKMAALKVHHVTTKESTANYEIITLELPEDSDGARAVDDGMKHMSSDAHQIEIYHLI